MVIVCMHHVIAAIFNIKIHLRREIKSFSRRKGFKPRDKDTVMDFVFRIFPGIIGAYHFNIKTALCKPFAYFTDVRLDAPDFGIVPVAHHCDSNHASGTHP